MNREEILERVSHCLSEVLDIEMADIHETSTLINDLGADSLDLLDLIFNLEQQFNIKLSVRYLEKKAKDDLGGVPVEIDGVYTPEAMERIRESMPEVPPGELPDGLTVQELPLRFRVATMVNLVEKTLEEKNV
ncbi:MAG: hypothetical protein GY749_01425 [Desulfobacteraceae bacterium]|nr:hypothetical protein [Desulfobacteraceae bacterium]